MPLNNPDPAAARIAYGSFAGDDTVNRAIPHGLAGTPKLIVIEPTSPAAVSTNFGVYITGFAEFTPVGVVGQAVTAPDSTNFYVGNAADYNASFNASTRTYKWVAFA